MKLLILSCSTGGGHNSAAAAIASRFEAAGHHCRVVNTLDFLPKATAELISKGHDFAYRHIPLIYGAGYRYEEKHASVPFYEQTLRGAEGLREYLSGHPADLVICVHVFSAMMMTELRHNWGLLLPTYFVATDYTCSPGVSDLDVDGFLIPHSRLVDEFTAAGIPAGKLYVTGIPVKEEFTRRESREEAREALGLSREGQVVLLATGSMGCGPIRTTSLRMERLLGENDRLVVICGKNKRLYRDLTFLFSQNSHVKIVGYTDKMHLYMRACDVLVTKAGGLSTTEAVAAGVPLLYLNAVPGCESRNIEFMTRWGYALAAEDKLRLPGLLSDCLSGAVSLQATVARREGEFPEHAADNIFRLTLRSDTRPQKVRSAAL